MDDGDFSFSTPALLVFGDRAGEAAAIGEIARRAGARIVARGGLADAVAAIEARASVGAVLIEAGDPATPALEALLARVEADAGAGRYRSVVLLPPALVDLGWSLAPHADVALLCDPAPGELLAAIADALAGEGIASAVHDEHGHPGELRRLSEEVGRIARSLAALSDKDIPYHPPPPAPATVVPPGAPPSPAAIRALIRARRLRERFLDPSLFADPGWDMLLDLMAARLEGRAVAVSSLCIAAAVPTSTALRWIKMLTRAGLLIRVADPADSRRFFVELADPAAGALAAYFAELERQRLPGG